MILLQNLVQRETIHCENNMYNKKKNCFWYRSCDSENFQVEPVIFRPFLLSGGTWGGKDIMTKSSLLKPSEQF